MIFGNSIRLCINKSSMWCCLCCARYQRVVRPPHTQGVLARTDALLRKERPRLVVPQQYLSSPTVGTLQRTHTPRAANPRGLRNLNSFTLVDFQMLSAHLLWHETNSPFIEPREVVRLVARPSFQKKIAKSDFAVWWRSKHTENWSFSPKMARKLNFHWTRRVSW